jgi:hypothetical protein
LKEFVLSNNIFNNPAGSKLEREKPLDPIGEFLQNNSFSLVVVAAYAGVKGDSGKELTRCQARAVAVRQYLVEKYELDDKRIKTRAWENSQSGVGPQTASKFLFIAKLNRPEMQGPGVHWSAAACWAELMQQIFDDIYDPHTSFANRMDNLYQTFSTACNSSVSANQPVIATWIFQFHFCAPLCSPLPLSITLIILACNAGILLHSPMDVGSSALR